MAIHFQNSHIFIEEYYMFCLCHFLYLDVVYASSYLFFLFPSRQGTTANEILILAGAHNAYTSESSQQVVAVAEIIEHPLYNPTTIENDIALLRLASPLTINAEVSPVCLPSETLPTGTDCWVTGWGETETGRLVKRMLYY